MSSMKDFIAGNVVEVKLTGWRELQEKLETLPEKAARRTLKTAATNAARIWRDEMKRTVLRGWHRWRKKDHRAPEFGFLSRNIVTRGRATRDLEAYVEVGPRKLGFWARYLEFGTKKMGAKPFIRPAFESRKQDVLEEFKKQLKEGLRREGLPIE